MEQNKGEVQKGQREYIFERAEIEWETCDMEIERMSWKQEAIEKGMRMRKSV